MSVDLLAQMAQAESSGWCSRWRSFRRRQALCVARSRTPRPPSCFGCWATSQLTRHYPPVALANWWWWWHTDTSGSSCWGVVSAWVHGWRRLRRLHRERGGQCRTNVADILFECHCYEGVHWATCREFNTLRSCAFKKCYSFVCLCYFPFFCKLFIHILGLNIYSLFLQQFTLLISKRINYLKTNTARLCIFSTRLVLAQ